MESIVGAFFFVLGTVIASFVGVLTGRLYTGQGVIAGRSRCDACGKTLGYADLVPIVSYALSYGRARCCGVRLSWVSPVSELVLGTLFVLSYLRFDFSLPLPFVLLSLTLLTALVLYDQAHHILPPVLLFAFVASATCAGLLTAPDAAALRLSLILTLAETTFFALLFALSLGRALGFADVPLVAGLALLSGPYAISGLLFSFWIGGVVGIVLLAGAPRGVRMRSEVPFAPFLAAGFLLAYFTKWDPFALSAVISSFL
jgi:prepilin signal peptidase PulO-like enzyme (type II secretory pathway)